MADVKCPSCGKINPEALEICQFCGTLLKQTRTEPLEPLLPGQFPEKKATAELERTLPGWLREARRAGNEPNTSPIPQVKVTQNSPVPPAQQPPSSPASPQPPASPLDLLAGLAQAGNDDEDVPDWLRNLQGETPRQTTPNVPSQDAQETPGWLAELENTRSEEVPPPQEAWGFSGETVAFRFDETDEPQQAIGGDTPDWLAALETQETAHQTQQQAGFATTTPGTESADTPDWLASLGDASAPPVSGQPASAETPDWLSDLQGTAAVEIPASPVAPTSEMPVTDLPDWLSDLQGAATVEAPAASITPASEIPSTDLPGWMADLQAAPTMETPAAPAETELPASDIPDWMTGLQAVPAVEPPTAPAEAELPASDIPDWMADLQATPAVETPAAPAEAELPASDIPDWMADLQATPTMETPAAPAQTELPASELPDWLTTAMGETPAAPEDARTSKPFQTGALEEIKTLVQAEPEPDFLSGLTYSIDEKTPESEPASATPETSDLPDWLASMAPTATATSFETLPQSPVESEQAPEIEIADASSPIPATEPSADSLLEMDVPDWLAGFTPNLEAEPQTAEVRDESADLRPVELPSWVQAMRPVESMLSGTETIEGEHEDVEQQGPLAGLRSVLPVQSDLLEVRKPKAYSLKIQVDGTQREQAALLEKLLASESSSKAVTPPQPVSLLRPLRWILFAVLTLAVLIPSILGTRILPAPIIPANDQDPFNKFYRAVEAIPDGETVLVVTDYQPGFAGEVEQVAAPVMVHLMRKNAKMAFLSTSPVSTEMGERLLQKGLSFYEKNKFTEPVYLPGEQYLFLGYLPGGAAGLKAFARQPQRTTGVDSMSGDLWESDMLQGKITNISSFAAVIVITDDPDNGRLWIEQTGALLENTPMLIVTSAQAGPMLQPYAVSGQLTGLVTGLEGGARYEKRDAQPGAAYPGHIKALYWDGFGVALIVALLALMFGAVWSLAGKFRARREEVEQDEAAHD